MGHLRIILPDQLDRSYISDWIEPGDCVLLAETGYLFTDTTHKRKLAFLCAAGRHLARELADADVQRIHPRIIEGSHTRSLADHVLSAARECNADGLAVHRPGSFCELREIEAAAGKTGLPLAVDEDRSFYATPDEFAEHISGRKQVVMEYFYRQLRKRHGVLMDDDEPAGGQWNFDKENRQTFGKEGPGKIRPPYSVDPDEITQNVIEEVQTTFPDNPGSLESFALPVTPEDARKSLADFIRNRLPRFGAYQDAMWTDNSFLFHSVLSPFLNTRLLSPREAVDAAEEAYRSGDAPINSVEGFIRQIIGWREFIRGVYYHRGPDYLEMNELEAERPVPHAFWTGRTDMACVSATVSHILETGYAHHIQRLMVMGLFAQLAGVNPYQFHRWHLALYLDAYDWVSAPNVIGMSQYADGGFLATKPYVASGKYIKRMGNYCRSCRYSPDDENGENACPFTTLYWDFLSRHRGQLDGNRRMNFQMKNLERKSDDQLERIRERAEAVIKRLATEGGGTL